MLYQQHRLRRRWVLIISTLILLSACAAPGPPGEQAGAITPTASPAASPTATSAAAPSEPAPVPSATAPAPAAEATATTTAAPSATASPAATPEVSAGRQIVYVRYDVAQQRAELRRIAMDGSGDQVMAVAPPSCDIIGLAVAPSGNQIAYSVGGCTTAALHLINADGSDDRVLYNGLSQVGEQAFSPDSTRLAFTAYREAGAAPVPQSAITLLDVAGTEPQPITPWGFFFGQPAWQSDMQLVYAQARTGTPPTNWTTYAVETSPDATPEAIAPGQLLAVSPDRTALLLAVEAGQGSESVRLALQSVDGGEPRPLDEQPGPLPRAAWAPDGETLAVTDWNARAISLLDVPSGQRSPVVEVEPMSMVEVRLVWDRTDKQLVYSTAGPDGATLHLFDATANTDQQIVALPSAATFLAVSADGAQPAALRPLEQEQLRICVAAAHGPLKPGVLDTVRNTVLNRVAQRADFQQMNTTLFQGAEPSVEEDCPGPATIFSPEWTGDGVKGGAPYRVTTPSPYFVWIFLAEEGELQQAFGTTFPRRTPQEMMCEGHDCAEINSAIYLTPAELQQPEQLERSLLWALGFEA